MRHLIPAPDDGTRKKCTKCGKDKPHGDFSPNGRNKNKLNAVCKACVCVRREAHKAKKGLQNKALSRNMHLIREYGITSQDYQDMFDRQNGRCACCGQPETTIHYGKVAPLAVDHCHVTGAVRGLLCRPCNQALGFLAEDPERIEALLKYVYECVLW